MYVSKRIEKLSKYLDVLGPGGVGRMMGQRDNYDSRLNWDTFVDDQSAEEYYRTEADEISLREGDAAFLVAKDQDTMRRAFLSKPHEHVISRNDGPVVMLSASYISPIGTSGNLSRLIKQPFRQLIGVKRTAQTNRMNRRHAEDEEMYSFDSGRQVYRERMQDRGFFVLFTGRLLLKSRPPGLKFTTFDDGYAVRFSSIANAL